MALFRGPLTSRQQNIDRMKSSEVFDILIIGGGATGTGVALDAATRGLLNQPFRLFDDHARSRLHCYNRNLVKIVNNLKCFHL